MQGDTSSIFDGKKETFLLLTGAPSSPIPLGCIALPEALLVSAIRWSSPKHVEAVPILGERRIRVLGARNPWWT